MLAGMGGSERRGIVVPASSNTRPQELSVPMLGQGGGTGVGGLGVSGNSLKGNSSPRELSTTHSQPATGPSLGICCGMTPAAPMSARSGSSGHDSHMSSPHSGGPPPPAPPAVPACKAAPRPPRSRSRSAPGSEQGETPISAMELVHNMIYSSTPTSSRSYSRSDSRHSSHSDAESPSTSVSRATSVDSFHKSERSRSTRREPGHSRSHSRVLWTMGHHLQWRPPFSIQRMERFCFPYLEALPRPQAVEEQQLPSTVRATAPHVPTPQTSACHQGRCQVHRGIPYCQS